MGPDDPGSNPGSPIQRTHLNRIFRAKEAFELNITITRSENMAVEKKAASGKRFGNRYGKKLREKVGLLENTYRQKTQKCPYCRKEGIKRVSAGIWTCRKCNVKFTGKAYSMSA